MHMHKIKDHNNECPGQKGCEWSSQDLGGAETKWPFTGCGREKESKCILCITKPFYS